MFLIANLLSATATVLSYVLQIYMWILIGRAIISWVNADPYNAIVRFLYQATEPLLYRIRATIPTNFGGIDFSPMIALLAIVFLQGFLVNSLYQLAFRLQ